MMIELQAQVALISDQNNKNFNGTLLLKHLLDVKFELADLIKEIPTRAIPANNSTPTLPALTGRTRVFDQSSNTRVRPVIGQTLSDRSAHQLVGQACPTSAWLVLSDQSGTLLDRCLPIRASWSTGAHRSDQAGRPVCTGQISLIDRVPVEHWWVCSTGACSTGAGSTGGSTILTIIESDRIEWDDDLETNSSERLNRQRSNRAVRRTGLFDRCTHQCSTRTLVEHPVRPVNRSDNLGRLAHWSTRLTRSPDLIGRYRSSRMPDWSDRNNQALVGQACPTSW
ncbi:hypothetical protein PCASD_23973 [Puccinia coronata f. sp. avenae]|uniref:Uncharacterized protein n=1 Tax=Puccinia coronata f. sp. avenae TaxID=200324 RepID=A0A2N5TYF4_9BASI|nr:hypothetical protein PCASD_23973 [Puccinia coronata f. sp. avenae]